MVVDQEGAIKSTEVKSAIQNPIAILAQSGISKQHPYSMRTRRKADHGI